MVSVHVGGIGIKTVVPTEAGRGIPKPVGRLRRRPPRPPPAAPRHITRRAMSRRQQLKAAVLSSDQHQQEACSDEPLASLAKEGGRGAKDEAVFGWAAAFGRNWRGETKPAPSTLQGVLVTFVTHPSVILVAVVFFTLLLHRFQMPFGPLDFAVGVGTVLAWLLQEWVIHAKLLHSSFEWPGKRVHESHHKEDYYHVSIDPPMLIAAAMLLSAAAFAVLLPPAPALTATVVYYAMGLLYEFNHYAVHTRYAPTWPLAKRIRRHHMLHHNRNFNHWLSFTAPPVDDLFGTNPRPATVPRRTIAPTHPQDTATVGTTESIG